MNNALRQGSSRHCGRISAAADCRLTMASVLDIYTQTHVCTLHCDVMSHRPCDVTMGSDTTLPDRNWTHTCTLRPSESDKNKFHADMEISDSVTPHLPRSSTLPISPNLPPIPQSPYLHHLPQLPALPKFPKLPNLPNPLRRCCKAPLNH